MTATTNAAAAGDKKRERGGDGDGDGDAMVECFKCGAADVKYRCPRCERVTCSLACCVAHKTELNCDGKRDRTKYIAPKDFTDADLSSDYFFLEEVSRSTNSAARSRAQIGGVNTRRFVRPPQAKKRRVGHTQPVNPHLPSDWLTRFPVACQLLVQHAAKRGVALTLLAPGMSKRGRNTSFMDTKHGTLYWRVEWVFPSSEVPVSLFEHRASDARTLFELLEQYFERRPDNAAVRGKLKQYAVPNWREHLVLLLRKEFTPASQPQYYKLDGRLSLESNLKRKAIVEFPVISVVLPSALPQYPLAADLIEVVEPVDGGQYDEALERVEERAEEETGEKDSKQSDGEEQEGEEQEEEAPVQAKESE